MGRSERPIWIPPYKYRACIRNREDRPFRSRKSSIGIRNICWHTTLPLLRIKRTRDYARARVCVCICVRVHESLAHPPRVKGCNVSFSGACNNNNKRARDRQPFGRKTRQRYRRYIASSVPTSARISLLLSLRRTCRGRAARFHVRVFPEEYLRRSANKIVVLVKRSVPGVPQLAMVRFPPFCFVAQQSGTLFSDLRETRRKKQRPVST